MRPHRSIVRRVAAATLAVAASVTALSLPVFGGTADAQTTYVEREIAPTLADPDARQDANKFTGQPNQHVVYLPRDAAARRGRLFLFIGGTNHFPSGTELIMQEAVAHGYQAISLSYANYTVVGGKCTDSLDADCSDLMRREIITGDSVSDDVVVGEHDAVIPRLTSLLTYLAKTYPDEGWDRFLDNGAIDWSQISVAGHSQGAGHAAWLAKHERMLRAVMISGVADTYLGQPAPWLAEPNMTPVEQQYAFSNMGDPVVPIAVAEASWSAIGLQGPTAMVDMDAPPYGGSHRLTTALPPRVSVPAPKGGINAHVSTIGDDTTPMTADGKPAYAPVWSYMAFP